VDRRSRVRTWSSSSVWVGSQGNKSYRIAQFKKKGLVFAAIARCLSSSELVCAVCDPDINTGYSCDTPCH
jgi:hypothetical protein